MTVQPEQQPSSRRYVVRTLLFAIIALPAACQLGAFLAFAAIGTVLPRHAMVGETVLLILGGALPAALGYLYGRGAALPASFSARYLPFVSPIIYLLAVWAVAMFVGRGNFSDSSFSGIVFFAFIPFFFLNFMLTFGGDWWNVLLVPLGVYSLSLAAFACATWHRRRFAVHGRRQGITAAVVVAVLALVCAWQAYDRSTFMLPERFARSERLSEEIRLHDYAPFSGKELFNKNLMPLRGQARLHIGWPYPRLDGATAFYPVYAAAVQAVYAKPSVPDAIAEIVQCSTTPEAYQRLIDGRVELIFAAAPSAEQKQAAQARGLTLNMTPLAREAFVFLVNRSNPVGNLGIEQIQGIYSGKIDNWRDLGGRDERIVAFQRPAGSGSQSTMISKVMKDKPLRTPLQEEFHRGMGGLVHQVASYRNDAAAIGYSFRYYTTGMLRNDQVRLLSVDGVAPDRANIESGAYPFTVNVYMVTARPVSENTQKLMDWFLGEQGQQLIEDIGYVPLQKR